MSTLTTRLGLYKPAADGSELVNVVTDLNNNLESLDTKVGAFACTSGARPGSPFNGQIIRETDTGKVRIWDGAAWTQVLYGAAEFGSSLIIRGGITADAQLGIDRPAPAVSTDHAVRTKLTADATHRFLMQVDGKMFWGDGTVAGDTNLYRSGANTLKTDDNFQVAQALTVSGATAVDDITVSGDLNIGSARYRNQLSTPATVANSTAETVVGTLTIPAADAVVGAIYRIHVSALASVSGTPTLTMRARIGGVAGNLLTATGIAVTAASNGTNHHWFADLDYVIATTGGAGTGRGFLRVKEAMSLGGAAPFTALVDKCDGGIATAVHDTTAAKDLVITVQWSAASVSNTTTAYVVTAERVA